MAKYRQVHKRIWKDPDFESYNSTTKLIFLYLCTNELTTESGIYAITPKTISQETGIPSATVSKLLAKGLKNIIYDFDNNCVFVKNFLHYNGQGSSGGSPELVKRSVINNYQEFNTPLWLEFIKKYPEYLNLLERVLERFQNGSLDLDIDIDLENSISFSNKGGIGGESSGEGSPPEDIKIIEEKIQYKDFVSMTEKEYQKLIDKHGLQKTEAFIEKLNSYKGSHGKKYKSDYLAILDWVVDAVLNKTGSSHLKKLAAVQGGVKYEPFD